jgi:hypothetical protein
MSDHNPTDELRPSETKSVATTDDKDITEWETARQQLADAPQYWIATVDPDGRPHVMPVFAVWLNGHLYSTSNKDRRKARNLAQNPLVSITASVEGFDLMVEGRADRITDQTTLEGVAARYQEKYDWPVTPRDGDFDAPYGAPAAGDAPYQVYEITLQTVFAFATTAPHGATRYKFS